MAQQRACDVRQASVACLLWVADGALMLPTGGSGAAAGQVAYAQGPDLDDSDAQAFGRGGPAGTRAGCLAALSGIGWPPLIRTC